MTHRSHFVAEVVALAGGRGGIDPRHPERAPLALDSSLAEGSYVEVRDGRVVSDGLAAPAGSAFASLVRIAIEHGLDPSFPPEVERETAAWLDRPGLDDPALVDLTHLPFVTIDNEGSRDLDQALHLEREGDGHRVRYALADAAYYVRPGTALFAEALARGASYYLPGWSIPMLPRPLSEGLVSLNPRVPRRALVLDMHLDAAGHCTRASALRARIESRAQLTYDGVQAFLDAAGEHPYAREAYGESLHLLREVGERRIADAAERDVVHHRRRVVEVGLDHRMAFVVYAGLRNDVERYNEQISLLCNVEGARMLLESTGAPHVQPIYRVHPRPTPDRIDAFEDAVAWLVREHGLTDARWRWMRADGQSLATYLRALPVEAHPGVARAIERQAILVNVRSTFSEEAAEHHGVGAEAYARFSAPMREIVGVFLHKELWEHLHGPETRLPDAPDDELLRVQIIQAANRARSLQGRIESLADRLALDAIFGRDLAELGAARPMRRGTLMGLGQGKAYVALDDPPLDVKVYLRDLARLLGEPLRLGPGEVTLERADGGVVARVGDAVAVRVEGRDEARDRWSLSLAPA